MRLDQELVKRGLCESRTEAQGIISSGNVLVNNVIVTKQIKQVSDTDEIVVTARRKFVSRGGEKLEGALIDVVNTDINKFLIFNFKFLNNTNNRQDTDYTNAIREIIEGKEALDVGSSTGGFTECLLSYGIAHVDAVDVGSEQLHQKLREDTRISLFENTDIRNFKSDKKYGIIVADLSFIPLNSVLKDIIKFGSDGTYYFLLIKPQFEVGKGNTKKGIVKNVELVDKILLEYKNLSEDLGLKNINIFPCHIRGGDGNQEFFLVGQI